MFSNFERKCDPLTKQQISKPGREHAWQSAGVLTSSFCFLFSNCWKTKTRVRRELKLGHNCCYCLENSHERYSSNSNAKKKYSHDCNYGEKDVMTIHHKKASADWPPACGLNTSWRHWLTEHLYTCHGLPHMSCHGLPQQRHPPLATRSDSTGCR